MSISTTTQANEGTSLETQHQLGVEKAKQLKFAPRHWNEGGKSSNHQDMEGRPVLLSLYEAIKRGEIKHLWVYDQSRLSRDDNVASRIRCECKEHGVTLYTKDGQFDLSNPTDNVTKQILDAMGQFENSLRAERTRQGKLARAKQGFWFGGPPPFGYKIEGKKLVINENEAVWVKRMFAETNKGASTAEIKKLLDSKGVLPRRQSGTWSFGSILALLKNTHYKGYYSYRDDKSGEKVEITCPAVVDAATWTAVQKLKARSSSRVSQKNRTEKFYLLRDLMFCAHCGRKMVARIKASKNERLYYCPNKERDWVKNGGSATPWKRGEGCGMSRSLNIPETDRLVLETVIATHRKSSILREDVKRKILSASGIVAAKSESELRALERRVRHLQKLLAQMKESQADLHVNHGAGEIEADIFKLALAKSREKIRDLDIEIANAEAELKGNANGQKWIDWYKQFGEMMDKQLELGDEQKRQYLAGLIEAIKVKYDEQSNEHELAIQFKLPIVGDGIRWKNASKKREGYKILNGSHATSVAVKKKVGRWSKARTTFTP